MQKIPIWFLGQEDPLEKGWATHSILGFLGGSDGKKKSAFNARDLGSNPGLGKSLEEGMATHSNIPSWIIPMDRGAWGAAVHGVAKSRTQLSDSAQHSTLTLYKWKWKLNEGKKNTGKIANGSTFMLKGLCQFSSVQYLSRVRLGNTMDDSTPGLPVYHQLPEFTQTQVHWVCDAIQPSNPLSSPSPAFSLSQHQGLFRWVRSSHQVAKRLELQL